MEHLDLCRWTDPAVILVATDLGDLARLMPVALGTGGQSGARLILLHVPATAAVFSTDAAGMPYYDPAGVLEFADQALLPWCEAARRQGLCAMRWCGKAMPPSRLRPRPASFRRIACFWGRGAGASSASCSSAPWQNKCCARSTSRSLPWDPRLISRWKTAARTGRPACHHTYERPPARARRLPAGLLPARAARLVLLHVLAAHR